MHIGGRINQKIQTIWRLAVNGVVKREAEGKFYDTRDQEARVSTPDLLSSSFDEAVLKEKETKSIFQGNGGLGADYTSDHINFFSTRVKNSLLPLSDGEYLAAAECVLEEVTNKDKVRKKKKE